MKKKKETIKFRKAEGMLPHGYTGESKEPKNSGESPDAKEWDFSSIIIPPKPEEKITVQKENIQRACLLYECAREILNGNQWYRKHFERMQPHIRRLFSEVSDKYSEEQRICAEIINALHSPIGMPFLREDMRFIPWQALSKSEIAEAVRLVEEANDYAIPQPGALTVEQVPVDRFLSRGDSTEISNLCFTIGLERLPSEYGSTLLKWIARGAAAPLSFYDKATRFDIFQKTSPPRSYGFMAVDWTFGDKAIIESLKIWLERNRPAEIPFSNKRKDSNFDWKFDRVRGLLNNISAARLIRHFKSPTKAMDYANSSGNSIFSDFAEWKRAQGNVSRRLRKLFPALHDRSIDLRNLMA